MLALFATTGCAAQASGVSLKGSSIAVDAAEPSYVQYTIGELRAQIRSLTGTAPSLYYDLKDAEKQPGLLVVVGRAMSAKLTDQNRGVQRITDQEPGPQGFVLKSALLDGGREVVVAAGSDALGTNYAVMRLRQLLIESPSGFSVPPNLEENEKPKYQQRGIYLHQHWRYNYPYATWAWSTEDWKRALDIAAYMRINIVVTWPHMDMMAPPLNVEEQEHLADLREVVEYAHRKRGIQIWTAEPTNVVLDSPEVKRLPLEQRDYYAFHAKGKGLKNPKDPKDFAVMMENRKAFIRAVPNADGYVFIDSDSGGWSGSPASEFIDVLVGNRELLDKYHEDPARASLVYWVWGSWGNGTVEENWHDSMRGFAQRVHDPREFLLGWAPHLAIGKEMGALNESMFNPYGVIEGEPTFPLTSINFAEIGRAFDYAARYPGMRGALANAQTFFAQLPNVHYFMKCAWDGNCDKGDDLRTLNSLATLLFPEKSDMLARAWAQLNLSGSGRALALATDVDKFAASGDVGRLGTVGSFVFPDPRVVPRILAIMLRIHGTAEHVREAIESARPQTEVMQAMVEYFQEMLKWQKINGFFGAYGVEKKIVFDNFIHGPDAKTVQGAWSRFTQNRSDKPQLQSALVNALSTGQFTAWVVDDFTGQLFGTRTEGEGDDNPIFRKLPPNEELRPWTKP